jgi:hypothetical protein
MWTSTHLFTSMKPFVMREYVRAEDPALRQALRLLHKSRMTEEDIEEYFQLLRDNVPDENYLNSWKEAPPGSFRIVSKRETVRQISDEWMKDRKAELDEENETLSASEQRKHLTVQAKDKIEVSPNNWIPASPVVARDIDHQVLEARSLFLSVGGVYRFTYNDNSPGGGRFTQGQLCIVSDIIESEYFSYLPPYFHDITDSSTLFLNS